MAIIFYIISCSSSVSGRNDAADTKIGLNTDQMVRMDNGIRIKKYPGNYTCFRIITSDGKTLILDPYNMDETVNTDIVTQSHQHYDHNDNSRIIGDYHLITKAGKYEIEGVSISGINGSHNNTDPSGKNTNIIYLFEIDGIRIAHFASQGKLVLLQNPYKE